MSSTYLQQVLILVIFTLKPMIIETQTTITIHCDDTTDCNKKNITCEQANHCIISCTGSTSLCKESTFICPYGAYNCTLNCNSADYQCANTTINSSQIDGGHLTVNIDSSKQHMLNSANILCPFNGDCTINDFSSSASANFGYLRVDASNTISGNLRIISHRELDIASSWNAANAQVYCPINGDCIVDVGLGWAVCIRCQFLAQHSTTLLSITARGTHALNTAQVTCPMQAGNSKNCIINDPNGPVAYPNALHNIQINSAESLTNLDLTSYYEGSVNTEYPPIIYCMNDYSESCALKWISSTEWTCIDTTSACHNWTPYPTVTPKRFSTQPTDDPTTNPTHIPTNNPITYAPTQDSSHPTAAPTYAPTQDPSHPTTAPTYDPTQDPTPAPSTPIPTHAPSEHPNYNYPTESFSATIVDIVENSTLPSDLPKILVIIICVVVLIMISGGGLIYYRRKETKHVLRKIEQCQVGGNVVNIDGGTKIQIGEANIIVDNDDEEGVVKNDKATPQNNNTYGSYEFEVIGDDDTNR